MYLKSKISQRDKLKHCLLLLFFFISFSMFAQQENSSKEMLLGKWVLQEASLNGFEEEISLDLYNSHTTIYPEIEVNRDSITFIGDEYLKTIKAKYEVSENYVGVEFESGQTLIGEWTYFENKLYVEYPIEGVNKTKLKVLLIYRK